MQRLHLSFLEDDRRSFYVKDPHGQEVVVKLSPSLPEALGKNGIIRPPVENYSFPEEAPSRIFPCRLLPPLTHRVEWENQAPEYLEAVSIRDALRQDEVQELRARRFSSGSEPTVEFKKDFKGVTVPYLGAFSYRARGRAAPLVVRAPSEARRFLSGESPDVIIPNQ